MNSMGIELGRKSVLVILTSLRLDKIHLVCSCTDALVVSWGSIYATRNCFRSDVTISFIYVMLTWQIRIFVALLPRC